MDRGKIAEQSQRVMEHLVKLLMPQLVESVTEQVRQVMYQRRGSKRSHEHLDVGTVHVAVLSIVDEDELIEVVQKISQKPKMSCLSFVRLDKAFFFSSKIRGGNMSVQVSVQSLFFAASLAA